MQTCFNVQGLQKISLGVMTLITVSFVELCAFMLAYRGVAGYIWWLVLDAASSTTLMSVLSATRVHRSSNKIPTRDGNVVLQSAAGGVSAGLHRFLFHHKIEMAPTVLLLVWASVSVTLTYYHFTDCPSLRHL